MTNHVLLDNNVVVQSMTGDPFAVFNEGFAERFVVAPDEVQIGWEYVDGKYIPPVTPDPKIEAMTFNAMTARNLLLSTDWVTLPDVSATTSNPRLLNVNEFLQYRNEIRRIVVDPPETKIENWPTIPTEKWSTANT